MQYAKTITRSGVVHAAEQGEIARGLCAVKGTGQKFAPEGAELTCKTCIAAVDAAAKESTGGVDGGVVIGYPEQQSAESTGGIVAVDQAVVEPESTVAAEDGTVENAPADAKKSPRRRAAKTTMTDGAVVVDQVPVSEIILDSEVQPREHISTQTISDYAEAMTEGKEFPAIVVYKDQASGALVAADGWHRVSAARQAGLASIKAEIRVGTKRDAILYSVSANATHGLRRTDADKRRAVLRLLKDKEWSKWSASVIAEKAGVTQPFVSGLRRQLEEQTGQKQTIQTSDGRTMNTEKIGRRPRPVATPDAPETNGHAPAATEPDAVTLLAGATSTAPSETEETDVETVDPTIAFAQDCLNVFMRLGDFDAKDVIGSLSTEDQQALGDKWESIIELFDKYTDALEAAIA